MIELDYDKITKIDITPIEYVWLYFLFKQDKVSCLSLIDKVDKDKLAKKKYVLFSTDYSRVSITANGLKLFEPTINRNIQDLAEKYRELWPEGVYTEDGQPVRSSVGEIKTKLEKFFKHYPKVTDEEILGATTLYIDKKKKKNDFWPKSAYFIIKQVPGEGLRFMLASAIDEYNSRSSVLESKSGLDNKTQIKVDDF